MPNVNDTSLYVLLGLLLAELQIVCCLRIIILVNLPGNTNKLINRRTALHQERQAVYIKESLLIYERSSFQPKRNTLSFQTIYVGPFLQAKLL